ncbi:MAG: START domain-containing protein [Bacteroidota bacterium]
MIGRIGLLILGVITFTRLFGQTSWKLRKDKDNIKVYTRDVENSKLDEFRGEVTISTSIDRIIELFQAVELMEKWVPDCKKATLIKLEEEHQYHYVETHVPFPLSNRDTYVHYHYIRSDKDVRVVFEGLPEYESNKKGLVRIPYLKGYWLLQFLDVNQTSVTYQVHADPGGIIPNWLANSEAIDNPFETLKNLKAYFQ